MKNVFSLGLAFSALCVVFGIAQAAPDEVGTETRPIDARVVRVTLDGAVDLRVRQGGRGDGWVVVERGAGRGQPGFRGVHGSWTVCI